ncbi:UNVERIFIED_CONTAM: hypothetical protein FKN15_027567 [Acipenser sinensis]
MNGLLIIICLTCTFARHVSPGEKAVIECDLQGASEITWYRHRAGQSPVAIVLFAKGSSLPPTYYNDFHSRRFSTSIKSGTIILTIEYFTEADSATYYCARKEKGEVMFGNGTQLTNEEPHMPHILMEEGDLTPEEYEEHLKGRSDFIKGTKTDSSCEKKTADTKPGLQGEASPDLQRTTSTSTESTAPAPEHPVRKYYFGTATPQLTATSPALTREWQRRAHAVLQSATPWERPVRALYNRNCGLRTEWLGSSFRGQSEAGHSGRRRRYGTWSHRPSTTADTKPGLQGEASPDLQRTTSTSTESTAPAPEHPVRNRVGSEVLFRDCNPWVLLLVIPIAG